MDTYVACTWVASLVALLFGVFKCRTFAEVLFGLSEADAQLELQERHYEKIKRKSLYWIVFLGLLLAGHTVAFYQVYTDSVGESFECFDRKRAFVKYQSQSEVVE